MRRPLSIMGAAPRASVTARTGSATLVRLTATFDEVGDAFAWAVKHREVGEVTTVEGHGKRWRYVEGVNRKTGNWKPL